jgi:hypothetical protein
MKIEEYAPEVMPIISASEKYLKLGPPKKKMEKRTIKTVKTVLMERPNV